MAERFGERVGQSLGNYRLICLLGKGGFAEVYIGMHRHLETFAAIKVLHARLAKKDEEEGFLTEARNIAHLDHPNIVRVLEYDVERESKTPFLAMNYAPSGTLRQHHPKGSPLLLATIMPYVRQIADALQYAHNENLIHRDVKPENMLLGAYNEALLSDFGISVTAQHIDTQVVGTPTYMAPEQFEGKACQASDQYALGIVVYEWLCGTPPFHGNYFALCRQHLLEPPPSLQQKVPLLPADVEKVVMTTLAKDPKDRFASVQAFAAALEQASRLTAPTIPDPQLDLESQPTLQLSVSPPDTVEEGQSAMTIGATPSSNQSSHSTPETILSKPKPPSKRGVSRRAVLLGFGGLTAVSGLVSWLMLTHRLPLPSLFGASPASTPSPTAITVPTPSPTPGSTPVPVPPPLLTYSGHSGGVDAVVWSLDGKRIASGSYDKTVQVWDAVNGSRVFTYSGHTDKVTSVAWSPDGRLIASGSFDRTVQVWDALNGSWVFTYGRHLNWVWAITWSPDGMRIASGGKDTIVLVWDAVNGGNEFIYDGHLGPVIDVAWSPKEARIASASDDKTVQVWNAVNGGQVITYKGHSDEVWAVAWSPDGTRIASGGRDKTVRVWDAATGNTLYVYSGHSDSVDTVAWSPDGKRIASTSYDKTVQVWDATDGSHVAVYRRHTDQVWAVAWSPGGNLIASGSLDKTVQVWRTPQ